MSGKFSLGRHVRIVHVDEIPYGQKYSFLESTIDKTGVIREYLPESARYVVCLDEDGTLLPLSESCLENADE
jgi:hypothetical protein